MAAGWLLAAYVGAKPAKLGPTVEIRSDPAEEAARREKAKAWWEAKRAQKAKVEAGIARLEADGVTRDELKDYFFEEFEDDARDAASQ